MEPVSLLPVRPRRIGLFFLGVLIGLALFPALDTVQPAAHPTLHTAQTATHTLLRDDVPDTTPPIVLITLESVRADHIGPCYGYNRTTAPNICSLAEDGILFKQTYSQGSWTPVAAPSLITGQNPGTVGLSHFLEQALPDDIVTVDRRLRRIGYNTSSHNKARHFYPPGDPFLQSATPARRQLVTGNSQFHWWFLNEAHGPYIPAEQFRKWDDVADQQFQRIRDPPEAYESPWRWWKQNIFTEIGAENLVALYDAEIAQGDARIGETITQLKDAGLYRDTLIIVTSDHGERLRPHEGRRVEHPLPGHAGMPDRATTHVPLIIKLPGNQYAGQRVAQPVRHIDVVPTIYDVIGIAPTRGVDGISLLPLAAGEPQDVQRPVYAAGKPASNWWIRSGNRTYSLMSPSTSCPSPSNKTETDQNMPRLRNQLCQLYRDGHTTRPTFSPGNTTQQQRERLKELGYLR